MLSGALPGRLSAAPRVNETMKKTWQALFLSLLLGGRGGEGIATKALRASASLGYIKMPCSAP